jgi:hypothetical protein
MRATRRLPHILLTGLVYFLSIQALGPSFFQCSCALPVFAAWCRSGPRPLVEIGVPETLWMGLSHGIPLGGAVVLDSQIRKKKRCRIPQQSVLEVDACYISPGSLPPAKKSPNCNSDNIHDDQRGGLTGLLLLLSASGSETRADGRAAPPLHPSNQTDHGCPRCLGKFVIVNTLPTSSIASNSPTISFLQTFLTFFPAVLQYG